MRFRATWPVEDPNLTDAELIAEARRDLPNVKPEGYALRNLRWSVEGGHVCLLAFATKLADRCKEGHAYTPDNTRYDGTHRRCNTCRQKNRKRNDNPRPKRRSGLVDHLPAESMLFYVAALGGIGKVCRQLEGTDADTFRRRLERAKEDGFMTVRKADDTCCRLLGVHPFVVFGDAWWTDDIGSVERDEAVA